MRKFFLILLVFIPLLNFAVPIDTGMIEWEQPNGVTFYARMVGDEFYIQFYTQYNYEIRQGSDDWFYYASESNGEIILTNLKVGIDSPPAVSYSIQQSPTSENLVNTDKELFKAGLLVQDNLMVANMATATVNNPLEVKIAVILVDFSDNQHYQEGSHPNGYKKSYFDNMFFSYNDWFDTNPDEPFTHPENLNVYGSVQNYYDDQSNGKVKLTGKNGSLEIMNPIDPLFPTIPKWVYLDETKDYWDKLQTGFTTSIDAEIKQKYEEQFGSVNWDEYDLFIYIYAGVTLFSNNLHPHFAPGLDHIFVSERWYTNPNYFTNIGVYCHEIGHYFGAEDEYNGSVATYYFDLMDAGNYNGPNQNGACPSGINPYWTIHWTWDNAVTLNGAEYLDYVVEYNSSLPNYYRINTPEDPSEYFIIENRLRDNFDRFTPNDEDYTTNDPKDIYNYNDGGLLVWSIDEDNGNDDRVGIKSASNIYDLTYNFAHLPFPYNATDGVSGKNLTHSTLPDNSIRNITDSGIEFTNIRWDSNKKCTLNISTSYDNFVVVDQNTTWNTQQPNFSKDLLILSGNTLTLEDGAILKFNQNKRILVQDGATLKIANNNTNPVLFTSAAVYYKWQGIQLQGENSKLEGSNFLIENTNDAITLNHNSNLQIEKVTFRSNLNTIKLNGIKEANTHINFFTCKFDNSPIYNLNTNTAEDSHNFANCLFYNSDLTLQANVRLSFINNDFKSGKINITGIVVEEIKNNVFYNCSQFSISSSEYSDVTYNCFYPYNNSIYSNFSNSGNFIAEPFFITNTSSQLQQYSPCIDLGDPSMDYTNELGINGGRINIGALGNTPLANERSSTVAQKISGTVLGDLLLPTTSCFNIEQNITFQNGSALIVNGTLNISGTTTNKVILDFQYAQNPPMNGIKINSGGTANISNAEIRNAYNGVYVNGGALNIDNSLIRNGYSGILLYNTNNSNNDTYITNTRIYEQTVGIDFYNSTDVHLSHNQIDHNYIALSTYGSSPYLAPDGNNSVSVGYNWIHTNSFGLMADYNSNPWLGRVSCLTFGGNNIIDLNTTKDINLNNNCTVYAENNYWGGGPGSYYKGTGCYVYDTPFLTSPPQMSQNKIKITPEEEMFNNKFPPQVTSSANTTEQMSLVTSTNDKSGYNESWQIEWKLLYARNLMRVKKYNQAAKICESVITEFPDSARSYLALDLLWQSRKNDDKTLFKQYVDNKAKSKVKKQLYGVAELMLAFSERANTADSKERVAVLDVIGEKYKDTPLVEHVLFQKFMFYLYEENNIELAKTTSAELGKLFPESESYYASQRHLGNDVVKPTEPLLAKNAPNEEITEIPKTYELLGNYPNPFNPSTTIKYALPYSSNVELTIYDITGKVVKVFSESGQSAGYQNIVWNGNSQQGSQVSSGVYLYRFKATSIDGSNKVFEKTAKLLMLK